MFGDHNRRPLDIPQATSDWGFLSDNGKRIENLHISRLIFSDVNSNTTTRPFLLQLDKPWYRQ